MLEMIMAIALFGVCVGYILWHSVFADMDFFKKEEIIAEDSEMFERVEFIRLPDGRLYEVEQGKASLLAISK